MIGPLGFVMETSVPPGLINEELGLRQAQHEFRLTTSH